MRYREVVIDGRVFLEIVDEVEDPSPPSWHERSDDERDEKKDEERRGPWIGELVPYA